MTTLSDTALARVEEQLSAVTQALQRGDPAALAEATQQLRAVAMGFARFLESDLAAARADVALRRRIEAARDLLILQREQIARAAARADLAVRTLLPGTQADSPTYGNGRASASAGAPRLYAVHS